MRIAIIGASHWHAPLYYKPALRLSGVDIVGVSDPDALAAQRVGAALDVPAHTDYRELITEEKPDFTFVFGRHCDLAEIGAWMIARKAPMLLEKPGGMNATQVAALRDQAAANGTYVTIGFNFLVSDMLQKIQAVAAEEKVTFCSFRYIGGGPYRYRESGCSWMLDPALSGGGSTINLSVHFFDMFRRLTGSTPTDVTALMGNHSWGLPIEDFSSVVLRSPEAMCTVETGYAFPAETGVFDVAFSIRTTRSYIVVRADDCMEIHRLTDGAVTRIPVTPRNAPWYPLFTQDCIDRFARDRPPIATLDDLTEAMKIVDAAYAAGRL